MRLENLCKRSLASTQTETHAEKNAGANIPEENIFVSVTQCNSYTRKKRFIKKTEAYLKKTPWEKLFKKKCLLHAWLRTCEEPLLEQMGM